jgi:hypothetical protein
MWMRLFGESCSRHLGYPTVSAVQKRTASHISADPLQSLQSFFVKGIDGIAAS